MVDRADDRPETTGSDQRPSRQMEAPSFQFRLADEFRTLMEEPAWSTADRNARTLVHEDGLRIMLLMLKAGARIDEHQTRGWVSILVQHGRVRIGVHDETLEARGGDVIVLRHNVPHTVAADEDSGLVLTFTAPVG